MNGLDALRAIKQARPDTVVVMITGNPGVENVRESIQGGAAGFIVKPFQHGEGARHPEQGLGRGHYGQGCRKRHRSAAPAEIGRAAAQKSLRQERIAAKTLTGSFALPPRNAAAATTARHAAAQERIGRLLQRQRRQAPSPAPLPQFPRCRHARCRRRFPAPPQPRSLGSSRYTRGRNAPRYRPAALR